MNRRLIIYISLLCCTMLAVGFTGAYFVFHKPVQASEKPLANLDEEETAEADADTEQVSVQFDEEVVSTLAGLEQRINPSTKMVYQYYYSEDGQTEEQYDQPPYFLVDMTRDQLVNTYQDWAVVAFSSKEVVLRKNIAGRSHDRYIIGVHEGYVAVYHKEGVQGIKLKEITDKPISSLPEEEQKRLGEGIDVVGEEQLVKIMEDYSS